MPGFRKSDSFVIWMTAIVLSCSGVPADRILASQHPEQQRPLILDIKTAVSIALAWNPDVQRADMDVELSRMGLDQAERWFHPSLSLSGGTSVRWTEPSVPGTNAATHSANVRLGSGYTVFNGFANQAGRDAAHAEWKGTGFTADRVVETMIYQVVNRFLDAAVSVEQVRVQQENVSAQQEMLEKITAFYEAGRRPVADWYQQRAETSAAEFRLLNIRRDYEMKALALLDRLGLSAGWRVELVTAGLDALRDILEPLPEPAAALAEAREKRSDYRSVLASLLALEHSVRAAKGGYWPDVSLSMDTGTSYSGSMHASWTDQMVKDNPYASVGVTISLPLYDRGQTRNAVASAELRLRRTALARQDLERQIEKEITTAYLEYRTAEKQLESAQTRIEYTRRALENYEQRYTVNASTLLEVIQARATHLTAIYEKIASEYNLIDKAVAIRYYMGDMSALTGYVGVSEKTSTEGTVL